MQPHIDNPLTIFRINQEAFTDDSAMFGWMRNNLTDFIRPTGEVECHDECPFKVQIQPSDAKNEIFVRLENLFDLYDLKNSYAHNLTNQDFCFHFLLEDMAQYFIEFANSRYPTMPLYIEATNIREVTPSGNQDRRDMEANKVRW
jgi:hypothetical protein